MIEPSADKSFAERNFNHRLRINDLATQNADNPNHSLKNLERCSRVAEPRPPRPWSGQRKRKVNKIISVVGEGPGVGYDWPSENCRSGCE